MKDFNIDLWKEGARIRRRDGGMPEEIVCLYSVSDDDKNKIIYSYKKKSYRTNARGRTSNDKETEDDLVIVNETRKFLIATRKVYVPDRDAIFIFFDEDKLYDTLKTDVDFYGSLEKEKVMELINKKFAIKCVDIEVEF